MFTGLGILISAGWSYMRCVVCVAFPISQSRSARPALVPLRSRALQAGLCGGSTTRHVTSHTQIYTVTHPRLRERSGASPSRHRRAVPPARAGPVAGVRAGPAPQASVLTHDCEWSCPGVSDTAVAAPLSGLA